MGFRGFFRKGSCCRRVARVTHVMETECASVDFVRRSSERLSPLLDEKVWRTWAASEMEALGRGGIEAVAGATGIARSTIGGAVRELGDCIRVRRTGQAQALAPFIHNRKSAEPAPAGRRNHRQPDRADRDHGRAECGVHAGRDPLTEWRSGRE